MPIQVTIAIEGRTLGELEITNVARDRDAGVADYAWNLTRPGKPELTGIVEGFRRAAGWEPLLADVARQLAAINLIERRGGPDRFRGAATVS